MAAWHWDAECSYEEGAWWRHSCYSQSVQFSSHVQLFATPCPSPAPRACSNSCPSSWWCHPTISSSVIPFSSCLQSFPASGSFPVNQFFASSGQSIGVLASASILPMNIEDWSPLGLTGLISLQYEQYEKATPVTHCIMVAAKDAKGYFHFSPFLIKVKIGFIVLSVSENKSFIKVKQCKMNF